MSKPVRLRDHLYTELEKLAARENRSLTNLVNHLLEQVLEMEERAARTGAGVAGVDRSGTQTPRVEPPAPVQADSQPRDVPARTIVPGEVKPDFKPGGKKK